MSKNVFKGIGDWMNSQCFMDNIYSQFGSAEVLHLPVVSTSPKLPPQRIKEVDLIASENFFFTRHFDERFLFDSNSFLFDLMYTFGSKYPGKSLYIFTDNQNIFKSEVPPYVHIISVPNKREDVYNAVRKLKEEIKPEPEKPHPWIIHDVYGEALQEQLSLTKRAPRKSRLANLPELTQKIHDFFR